MGPSGGFLKASVDEANGMASPKQAHITYMEMMTPLTDAQKHTFCYVPDGLVSVTFLVVMVIALTLIKSNLLINSKFLQM